MALRTIIDDKLGKDPEYEFLKILGRGAFGVVSEVRHVKTGQRFACKSIDCSMDENGVLLGLVKRELATWTTVGKEKYITQYHDCSWVKSTSNIRIYMKLYEGGDLQGVIDVARSQGSPVHPIVTTACALQIAHGVQTCHQKNIIHRDLKPANVLLDSPFHCNSLLWKATNDPTALASGEKSEIESFLKKIQDSPWCHISDFGLSKFSSHLISAAHQSIATFSLIGTPAFMAPETIGESGRFSSKSDVYSLGCLIYYLCECRVPFIDPSKRSNYKSISSDYPQELRKLIDSCLDQSSSNRPEIGEFVKRAEQVNSESLSSMIKTINGEPAKEAQKDYSAEVVAAPEIPIHRYVSELSSNALALRPREKIAPTKKVLTPEDQKELDNKLNDACRDEREKDVLQLLEQGANPGFLDSVGENTLHVATWLGNLPIVEALIKYGVDVNSPARTRSWAPLHFACDYNQPEIVKYLIDHGANVEAVNKDGQTPLFRSVLKGHHRTTLEILVKGANVNHQDRKGATALHYAVENEDEDGDFDKIPSALLLVRKVDPNLHDNDNYTPLHRAAARDCSQHVKLLLDKGADKEAKGGKHETTPLHKACWEGSLNAAKCLLDHGANIRAKSSYDNNLPIHIAARKGYTAIGTILLERDKGCIHGEDTDGWTPLHIAARWNSLEFARLLIKHGANPHALTNLSSTPRDVTLPIVHYKMRKLLEEAERAKSPPLRLNRNKDIYLRS